MTVEATAAELESRLHAVPVVRHRARTVLLEEWGLAKGDVLDALQMLSELVANAARHSPPGMHHVALHLAPDGTALVMEVHDLSRAVPYVPAGAREDGVRENGRGLLIVADLAEGWGWVPTSGGKKVWAQLRLAVPVQPPHPRRAVQGVPEAVLRRAAVTAGLQVSRLCAVRRPRVA
nr:ATP-binding protein [Kitasatospora sp. SID7827]